MNATSLTSAQAQTVAALSAFRAEHSRFPSIGELAQEMGKSRAAIYQMLERLKEKDVSIEQLSADNDSQLPLQEDLEAQVEDVLYQLLDALYLVHEATMPDGTTVALLRRSTVASIAYIVTAHRAGSSIDAELDAYRTLTPSSFFSSLLMVSPSKLVSLLSETERERLLAFLEALDTLSYHRAAERLWPATLHYEPGQSTSRSSVRRRTQGVYLTPAWLADRTIEEAIGHYLLHHGVSKGTLAQLKRLMGEELPTKAQRRIKRLLRGITVVDPASGIGTFLCQAYDLIMEWRSSLVSRPMRAVYAKSLIDNQLFGVDRNPLAVAFTKAVLWFRASTDVGTGHQLQANIKCGDALTGRPIRRTWGEVHAIKQIEPQDLFGNGISDALNWDDAFPSIKEQGGFDIVVGNPPWEKIKVLSREFFEVHAPDLSQAPTTAARDELIGDERTAIQSARKEKRKYKKTIRESGWFEYSAVGELNLYPLFVERSFQIADEDGVVGMIIPSGILSDYHLRGFARAIRDGGHLIKFADFENRKKIFKDVDGRQKFAISIFSNRGRIRAPEYGFYLQDEKDLNKNANTFIIDNDSLYQINPNTYTLPVVRSKRDLRLLEKIHARVPILDLQDKNTQPAIPTLGEQDWSVQYRRLFDMTNDSHKFISWSDKDHRQHMSMDGLVHSNDRVLARVYEGRMIDQYDHRAASSVEKIGNFRRPGASDTTLIDEHQDPRHLVASRYLIDVDEVYDRLGEWRHKWLLGYMDICSATNRRTMVSSILPICAAGNKVPLLLEDSGALGVSCLLANFNSFVFDYAVRQHIGGITLNKYIIMQCPVLPKKIYHSFRIDGDILANWVSRRVLRLTYNSSDLKNWAVDLDYEGPPFKWDPHERRSMRIELDALMFVLYGIDIEELVYIMNSFPAVRNEEEDKYGDFRLMTSIIESYEEVQDELYSIECEL